MDQIRTIHRLFPYGVEWLKARHEAGQHIACDDISRIFEYDRTSAADPVMSEYLLWALRGQLKRRPGPKRKPGRFLAELYAADMVEDLAARLAARRERQRKKGMKKTRSQFSATELALHVVAPRVFMEPGTLRNVISARRYGR